MALPNTYIPVLEGEEAERFLRIADENLKKKGTVKLRFSSEDLRKMEEKSKRFIEKYYASKKD